MQLNRTRGGLLVAALAALIIALTGLLGFAKPAWAQEYSPTDGATLTSDLGKNNATVKVSANINSGFTGVTIDGESTLALGDYQVSLDGTIKIPSGAQLTLTGSATSLLQASGIVFDVKDGGKLIISDFSSSIVSTSGTAIMTTGTVTATQNVTATIRGDVGISISNGSESKVTLGKTVTVEGSTNAVSISGGTLTAAGVVNTTGTGTNAAIVNNASGTLNISDTLSGTCAGPVVQTSGVFSVEKTATIENKGTGPALEVAGGSGSVSPKVDLGDGSSKILTLKNSGPSSTLLISGGNNLTIDTNKPTISAGKSTQVEITGGTKTTISSDLTADQGATSPVVVVSGGTGNVISGKITASTSGEGCAALEIAGGDNSSVPNLKESTLTGGANAPALLISGGTGMSIWTNTLTNSSGPLVTISGGTNNKICGKAENDAQLSGKLSAGEGTGPVVQIVADGPTGMTVSANIDGGENAKPAVSIAAGSNTNFTGTITGTADDYSTKGLINISGGNGTTFTDAATVAANTATKGPAILVSGNASNTTFASSVSATALTKGPGVSIAGGTNTQFNVSDQYSAYCAD